MGFCCDKIILAVLVLSRLESVTQVELQTSPGIRFHPCSSTGSRGPTQYQCDIAYKGTKVEKQVRVLPNGAQVWTVQRNGTNGYYITAIGATGGTGVRNPMPPESVDYVWAGFNLTKGDEIYMVIGQQGESACSELNKKTNRNAKVCENGSYSNYSEKVGKGGGGGGGTFVYKRDPQTGKLTPLIIAGGRGGNSEEAEPVKHNKAMIYTNQTKPDGPGAGGGWSSTANYSQTGRSLLEDSEGGTACPEAIRNGWEISGGFGGGGGACRAGGGGGGYTGGHVSYDNNKFANGQPGRSYISPDSFNPNMEIFGPRAGHGDVEINMILDCPCDDMCLMDEENNKNYSCFCTKPFKTVLAEDGHTCISEKLDKGGLPAGALIAAILGVIVSVLSLLAVVVYLVYRRNNKHLRAIRAIRLDPLTQPDSLLDRQRSTTNHSNMAVTQYNPNYDFVGDKCILQDLREISREHLTLVRALGQGAFGEVYQGYLSSVPREPVDLPVAVKTLPALSTDHAEFDFLMEAFIMSKFSHPNIVRFIGVCFKKHPKFIILELLQGGDLKTFLREARPEPNRPPQLTMVDLVNLSLDIAKGSQYLEENHFIHRDIAARNCLLTTKGPSRVAKIADFGMAKDIYRADYYRKGGKAMLPVKWMPPEAFLDGIFTSKTDVWSFGILLWEVFSLGYMPYPGRCNQEVMQLVTVGSRLESPQHCPPPVYHIMTMCWHGNPDKRPTFSVIIDNLLSCLQDPKVLHSPLPVFHKATSIDHDITIMRPRDPDGMVLRVDPPHWIQRSEPGTLPSDQVTEAQQTLDGHRKLSNFRESAESLDKLLQEENDNLENEKKRLRTFYRPSAHAQKTANSADPNSALCDECTPLNRASSQDGDMSGDDDNESSVFDTCSQLGSSDAGDCGQSSVEISHGSQPEPAEVRGAVTSQPPSGIVSEEVSSNSQLAPTDTPKHNTVSLQQRGGEESTNQSRFHKPHSDTSVQKIIYENMTPISVDRKKNEKSGDQANQTESDRSNQGEVTVQTPDKHPGDSGVVIDMNTPLAVVTSKC